LGTSGLFVIGWFAMGQFGHGYLADGELSAPALAHQRSRKIFLGFGGISAIAGSLLTAEAIGHGVAAVVVLMMSAAIAFVIFSVWYSEWRMALGLDRVGRKAL
jgi:hypothetical protein